MSNARPHPPCQRAAGSSDKLFLGMSFGDYLKSLITPGNLIAGLIMAIGVAAHRLPVRRRPRRRRRTCRRPTPGASGSASTC